MSSPYRGLRSGDFRLLTVVKFTPDQDLRFRFRHAVPSQTQQYTAISYTWGSDTQTKTIHIDDQPVRITPNLWACLYHLRHSWQYIWADAVCINQDDVKEKNQQVRMMDRIYQNATVVSVWLGLIPVSDWLQVSEPIDILKVDDFDWANAMEDLANRPYWMRSWTIQEYLLARQTHVYCSNSRVEGQSFQDLLSYAVDIDLLTMGDDDLAARPDLIRRWPALSMNVGPHIGRLRGLDQPLYELLIRHANAQSKDPRDKVFALLGVVQPDERRFLMRSFPNYDLSMEQVNAVTLAHVRSFSVDQPLEPIYRALRIPEGRYTRRLAQIIDRFDYIGAYDPATEVALMSSFVLLHSEDGTEAQFEECLAADGDIIVDDVTQSRNVCGTIRKVGGAIAGFLLLYIVASQLCQ